MYIKRGSGSKLGATDLMSIRTAITGAPVSTKSGTTYYPKGEVVQNAPTPEPQSSTASDIMGAVGGILGALVTPAAAIYSAKLQADAQKSAAKAAAQSMLPMQQPVIIQQSSGSNAPIWIVLGILGVISIGGIVFLLSKQ